MKSIVLLVLATMAMGLMAPPADCADGLPPATGDLHRTHQFPATGETVPYRLFVPSSYRGDKDYPMVVVLHGGGADQNAPLEHTGLQEIASKHGYIVLSPLGYNRFGGFGNIYPVVVTPATAGGSVDFAALSRAEHPGDAAPAMPVPASTSPGTSRPPAAEDEYVEQPAGTLADAHVAELSEAETLAAVDDVRKSYRIDGRRIYLMGNSAGGIGTLYLAAKHPEMWAAIAPQGGVIAAWSYPYWRLRDSRVAALFVHGQRDEHCNARWSRAMVDRARADGADASFLLVPNGSHGGAWVQALPQIFDFFAAHEKPG